MKNKIIIPTILFIIVLVFSFFVLSKESDKSQTQTNEPVNQGSEQNKNQTRANEVVNPKNSQTEKSRIILFYGKGCPHCALVEKYINENKIQDKISFAQKEVYYNQSNAKELEAKAKICGLPTDAIGVPFLWDGEKCLIGDQDIINFFRQKTSGK
jgi:glutaredoxin